MDPDGFAAAMARVDVIAYTPTEFLEEKDVTIGRCRDLVEKYAVTWVNVVGLDDRTAGELETLFGAHPLALDDARNQAMAPKVDVYDDVVFIIARAITWTEEIDTDPLSLFVTKKFLITVHDQGFAQLEDVRIRLRKKNPKMVKSGTDFLAYTILDAIVDSYFPQLDRFQSIVDQLEEDIIEQPSGQGISRLHSLRSDLVRVRNALRPQREMFAVLGRLEIPSFRNETRTYLRDVQEHTISALDTLDANRETVASLMEVQATLASNQMNEVIKVLTVIFTITLPIAIVSSAFGMNVTFYGFNRPEGLYAALALMAIPTVVLAVWMLRNLEPYGFDLLARVDPKVRERCLDIATGPGEPAMSLARMVGPDGKVVGIDLSEQMVQLATRIASQRRIPSVEFRTMDAEKMDFPDESFDLAVSRFGFQIFTNPEAVARETYRVLAPKGRIGVAIWSTAERASAIHAVVGPMLEFAEPDETGYLPTPI